ncbi:ABC transporter ATP-binding protein [Ramlibacter sp. 2FC]|uniref:ABC transporter ATP-binding protein n=1 Tax=Ramlibacter sp. 2FC TaxID=2502188 RepID=UPI0010F9DDE0|nr:ABC transporter ATP-binding protein [Ramlibacter sp. 2FC]
MSTLLQVRDLEVFYGTSQALFGVSLEVCEGECVTLIGRNGMGRSTLVHTVMGMLRPRRGAITLRGRPVHELPSFRVAQAGIGLVPEGRRIFPTLTVRENLVATARTRPDARAGWTLERVYAMFPRLRERERNLGANLSGGEQQMLAIGRALLTNPDLLILDEATEGLSPLVRQEIWRSLAALKAEGLSLLVVDKDLEALMRLGDRHIVFGKGRVAWTGNSQQLRAAREVQDAYIGV